MSQKTNEEEIIIPKPVVSSTTVLQKAYDAFQVHSKNHRIGLDEFGHALSDFKTLHISPETTKRLLEIADIDHDGALNFSEFYNVYACLQILEHHFEVDDMRQLRLSDLKRALYGMGLNPTQDQIQRMMKFGDSHAMGKDLEELFEIDLEKFLRIYLETPLNRGDVFIHSWYSAGKNSVPYIKPAEITPSQDFVAGTLAGVALTLVGHPFDTVKVRLQTSHAYKGAADCVMQTLAKENFLAFWKGMGSPLATIPLLNAIVFGAYAQGKDILHKLFAPKRHLNLAEITLAGAYAGGMSCLIACPVELIKTKLQVQTTYANGHTLRGPVDAIRAIISHQGPKGLYRGMSSTIYREIPGYGGQFFLYEYLKGVFTKPGEDPKDLGAVPLIFAGGFAGIFGWVLSYPMDYVKSQLQAEPYWEPSKFKKNKWLLDGGFFDCWKQTVKLHGHKELWRGFVPCVARAFPANGAGFLAYELALKFIRSLDE